VIVVDDEPAALNHVCMALQKKCPTVEVVGRADNGIEALRQIEAYRPDVLITDIQMPEMDGTKLVSQVKEKYPDILSVIVSGYSEFEYAKKALTAGVCDYLLKPLTPMDVQNMMTRLEKRLDALYHQKRNQILKALCKGEQPSNSQLRRYFPSGQYYSVIIRRNGLPKRFSVRTGIEIFSMEEEKVYIYGRDEMEALHLLPEELLSCTIENSLCSKNFNVLVERLFDKSKEQCSYVTAIAFAEPFELAKLSEVAKKLYRRLDETIVIGENQLQYEDIPSSDRQNNISEKEALEKIEYVIRYKELGQILPELQRIFAIWKQNKYSQLHVEARVKYIFQLIINTQVSAQDVAEIEYLIDDTFYYATTMEELQESIISIVKLCVPSLGYENLNNKEKLFRSILSYLNGHLEQAMTLNSICQDFGLSQTTLSRMFRRYENTSFNNYLTEVRIRKAQEFMKKDSSAYIKDIAERVGYNDQFYFSRIFRSVTGMSPREYMDTI